MGLRDHAILEVLYGCGLRVSELVGLDVGDIHIDDGFVLVRGKAQRNACPRWWEAQREL